MSRDDYRILEALVDPDILEVQSPAVIAYNLDMTRPHISKRLSKFAEEDLVEKIQDGRYRITKDGRLFIKGELDPDTIE
jgi:predicted transcriptional regulator